MSPELRTLELGRCKYCSEQHDADVLKCPKTDMILELDGRRLAGRFRFVERLGAGGMAEVWLANNEAVERKVAIKLLKPEITRDDQVLHRFKLEARASGRIGSPHVCQILDLGHDVIGPYMVMEWLRGHDLGEWVEAEGRLPVPDAVWVVRNALKGLADAHAAGVLHRDLKPGNIFVHYADSGEQSVKLMDFGVSKFADTNLDGHTRAGMMLGTPEYMAPEQLFAASDIDEKADIWSVGAILYRILSGRQVFRGENLAAVCHAVANDDPIPVDSLVGGLPPELVALIGRCLQRDPEQRPASVAEISLALIPFEGPRQSNFHRPERIHAQPSPPAKAKLRGANERPRALAAHAGARLSTLWAGFHQRPAMLRAIAAVGVVCLAGLGWAAARRDAGPDSNTGSDGTRTAPVLGARVDRGLVAEPLTAKELGMSDREHASLFAGFDGDSPSDVVLLADRAPGLASVSPGDQRAMTSTGLVAALPEGEALEIEDDLDMTASESWSEVGDQGDSGESQLELLEESIAEGESETGERAVEQDEPIDVANTPATNLPDQRSKPAIREPWARLMREGDLVAQQERWGKALRLPSLEHYPAKLYCRELGKSRAYGLRSWHMASPSELRAFVKKRGTARGRFWTTARHKNRARVISLPSGRNSSEHVTRKKFRPFCVAKVR